MLLLLCLSIKKKEKKETHLQSGVEIESWCPVAKTLVIWNGNVGDCHAVHESWFSDFNIPLAARTGLPQNKAVHVHVCGNPDSGARETLRTVLLLFLCQHLISIRISKPTVCGANPGQDTGTVNWCKGVNSDFPMGYTRLKSHTSREVVKFSLNWEVFCAVFHHNLHFKSKPHSFHMMSC